MPFFCGKKLSSLRFNEAEILLDLLKDPSKRSVDIYLNNNLPMGCCCGLCLLAEEETDPKFSSVIYLKFKPGTTKYNSSIIKNTGKTVIFSVPKEWRFGVKCDQGSSTYKLQNNCYKYSNYIFPFVKDSI